MIRISKRTVEKLNGTRQSSQKNLFRVFVSGMAGIRGDLIKPFDLKQLEEAMSIPECGLRNVE